jgi:hypothetical protein
VRGRSQGQTFKGTLMPKRVLDGEALWGSTKLSECPEWAILYYSWLYPLADANGSFELTNLRVIWCKVAAILPNFTLDVLTEIIRIFEQCGLLFTWSVNGKRYGHWTGSEKPGRLPQPARRNCRYGPLLAPPVPREQLQQYQSRQQTCRAATAQTSLCDINCVAGGDSGSVAGSGVGLGIGEGNPSLSEAGASDQAASGQPAKVKSPKLAPSDAGRRAADFLRERIHQNNPTARITDEQVLRWAGEADAMMRLDKRTEQQMLEHIDWSQKDQFWRSNILSIGALRKQFDRITMKMQEESSKRHGGTNGNGRSGGALRPKPGTPTKSGPVSLSNAVPN